MSKFSLIKKEYDPIFSVFDFANRLDDFFQGSIDLGPGLTAGSPAVDIYEKDNKLIVDLEVPGVKVEDLKVVVEGNILTITGEKKRQKEHKDTKYYLNEVSYGKFQRSFELPAYVEVNKIKSEYKSGNLRIEMPKTQQHKKKEIKIDAT